MKDASMSSLALSFTGKGAAGARWPLLVVAVTALLCAALGSVAVTSYFAADRSDAASLHAALAQRQLQSYLRGVNEVLLTEGSSSSRKLVKDSGAAFASEVALLSKLVTEAEDQRALEALIAQSWPETSDAVGALLRRKGVSATDDDSMLAYGKIAGRADALVEAVAGIEQRAAPAAERALVQMKQLMIAAALVALVFVLAIGRQVMQVMYNRLGAHPEQVRGIALRLASHDLTVTIPGTSGTGQATLIDALRDIRNNLSTVVGEVHGNASSLAIAAAEIAEGNQDLSNRTEQQASALAETAASMEQLGTTVRQNADNARQANQMALNASTVAIKGGEVVGEVVQTMKGINDASTKIADIISVIDGIAFQTNILALNAAVEAARAGEQGRGFAVVAGEVRSLAQRSADAAREIKSLISDSVQRVHQGTEMVDQAGATMREIVTSIERVTDIMGEISNASAEQSAGVAQVGEAVSQMDQSTQQNAALVEQSAAAAESLKEQAQRLVQAVAVFKLGHEGAEMAGLGNGSAMPRGAGMARGMTKPSVYVRPVAAAGGAGGRPAVAATRRLALAARPAAAPPRPPALAHAPVSAPSRSAAGYVPTPMLKDNTDDWETF